MVSVNTLASGISACFIITTALLSASGCFRQVKKTNNSLLWFAGIFLATMGGFYLGTVCSFFNLLINGENLPTTLVGQLCYMWVPIGSSASMYVGFKIIKPSIAKSVGIIFLIVGIYYWYGLFFQSDLTITSEIPEDGKGLIDIQLLDFVGIMTKAFLAAFGAAMIGGFMWLYSQSSGLIKQKALFHSIGYLLFIICGYLDSSLEFSHVIYLVITRIVMIISYIFLYLGFTKTELSK